MILITLFKKQILHIAKFTIEHLQVKNGRGGWLGEYIEVQFDNSTKYHCNISNEFGTILDKQVTISPELCNLKYLGCPTNQTTLQPCLKPPCSTIQPVQTTTRSKFGGKGKIKEIHIKTGDEQMTKNMLNIKICNEEELFE